MCIGYEMRYRDVQEEYNAKRKWVTSKHEDTTMVYNVVLLSGDWKVEWKVEYCNWHLGVWVTYESQVLENRTEWFKDWLLERFRYFAF